MRDEGLGMAYSHLNSAKARGRRTNSARWVGGRPGIAQAEDGGAELGGTGSKSLPDLISRETPF